MSELRSFSNIKAMISLLDDPDQDVFKQISTELISMGTEVVPMLEEAWETAFDPVMQERIENIIHKIQFDGVKEELRRWALSDDQDLLTGALLVARYQYPDLDESAVRGELNRIKRDIWMELSEYMTPQERVMVMNKVLFEREGFAGNTANFHAPQNSFLHTVVESRKGNPLLLSTIYMILAKQLDMPVFGINLPEHFILAYQDPQGNAKPTYTYPQANIVFYINAFNKGSIFLKGDIDQFIRKLGLEFDRSYYEPCSNTQIIRRMILNLSNAWQKLGETVKANEVTELLNHIPESPSSGASE
jgi:regulator of sirC expression with transglutaminase-like and TPR domain